MATNWDGGSDNGSGSAGTDTSYASGYDGLSQFRMPPIEIKSTPGDQGQSQADTLAVGAAVTPGDPALGQMICRAEAKGEAGSEASKAGAEQASQADDPIANYFKNYKNLHPGASSGDRPAGPDKLPGPAAPPEAPKPEPTPEPKPQPRPGPGPRPGPRPPRPEPQPRPEPEPRPWPPQPNPNPRPPRPGPQPCPV